MTPEAIQRINELARKAKAQGLTPEEAQEQKRLRQEYLDSVRKKPGLPIRKHVNFGAGRHEKEGSKEEKLNSAPSGFTVVQTDLSIH
ncbi:MAG: DUF896 domain-containing protein [[Clostridium] leptum]